MTDTHFENWRIEARQLLQKGIAPSDTYWENNPTFLESDESNLKPLLSPQVPPEFFELAQFVACARDENRWSLLYRIIYRLNHENKNLLKVSVDPDVHRANELAKSVRRDIHKMHAFVRFKKIDIEGVETYIAWHKAEHLIVELGTPFFMRRFGDKPWSIFTPDASAHWDLKTLTFAEGIPQHEFQHRDQFDEVWKTYYKSIFNPARLKIKMMKAEMSPKYWSSMPEAEIIHDLIRNTPLRLQNMANAPKFKAEVPENVSWQDLKKAALKCKACPLAAHATQTVFGEGNLEAELMIIGEQPGDEEDLNGQVFVGPAGKILADALQKANVSRESIYITNAVKHFKFTQTDNRRVHQKAKGSEMQACKPWLEAEIARVKPKVIIALGTTAATAIYGRLLKIKDERGKAYVDSRLAKSLFVSWHPAAILRASSIEEQISRQNELAIDIAQAMNATKV
ncbi:MAG: UdgX family uracil-DNA binding protein [Bdellovibrio sp.]|nr:UdgX family uracil-DNA binding protein [Bdellovibrio sp.]